MKRKTLPAIFFFTLFCHTTAFAEDCLRYLNSSGLSYETLNGSNEVYIGWNGGALQRCTNLNDGSNQMYCGERRFGTGADAVFDKTGKSYQISYSMERREYSAQCEAKSRSEYVNHREQIDQGLVENSDISVKRVTRASIPYVISRPSF